MDIHRFCGNEKEVIVLILITYDVATTDSAGRKRLRDVAKECVNYGQRVQNSVFECEIDNAKWRTVKYKLEMLIDPEKDSIRYYYLGKKGRAKIEHHGVQRGINVSEALIF